MSCRRNCGAARRWPTSPKQKGVDIAVVKAAVEAAQVAETKTAIATGRDGWDHDSGQGRLAARGPGQGLLGSRALQGGDFGFGMGPGMASRRAARWRADGCSAEQRCAGQQHHSLQHQLSEQFQHMRGMSVACATLILFNGWTSCPQVVSGHPAP